MTLSPPLRFHTATLLLLHAALLCPLGPSAHAATFEWDGGAGDSLWNSVIISGGVQTNWSPENVPTAVDDVVLTGASTPGPVTIDLESGTQTINRLAADGIDGVYTFENGVLELVLGGGNAILADEDGGELQIDAALLLALPRRV